MNSENVIKRSLKETIRIIKYEYRLNCGSHSFLYNILYPNYCYKLLLYLRIYEYLRSKSGGVSIITPFIKLRYHRLSFKTKIEIPTFTVGEGCKINHTVGNIVINSRATIGKHCYLSNGVIIGTDNIHKKYNVPTIGDNVHLAPNAKVFGKVNIGDNTIIGTDCIVMRNVEANSCIVGTPARIVKKDNVKCNILL